MKKISIAALLILFAACTNNNRSLSFQRVEMTDSTPQLNYSLSMLLPDSNTSASRAMRDTLLSIALQQLAFWWGTENEEDNPMNPLPGESLTSYARRCQQAILKEREAEEAEMGSALDLPWDWQMTIDTVQTNSRYVTFVARGHQYTGGAHGGIFGEGAITFRRSDGKHIDQFFTDPTSPALHQLMLQGLCDYFTQGEAEFGDGVSVTLENLGDYLLEDTAEVRLPMEAPCPTAEGLSFIYQQYEVAAYAAGMPTFVIPYDQILPHLTDEVRLMLGK